VLSEIYNYLRRRLASENVVSLGVTLSRARVCLCIRRLHAALVSAAKVMRCIQCCLFMCCSLRQTGSFLNMTQPRSFSLRSHFPTRRQVKPAAAPVPTAAVGQSATKKPILGEIQLAGSTAKACKVGLYLMSVLRDTNVEVLIIAIVMKVNHILQIKAERIARIFYASKQNSKPWDFTRTGLYPKFGQVAILHLPQHTGYSKKWKPGFNFAITSVNVHRF